MTINMRNPLLQAIAPETGTWSIDLITKEISLCKGAIFLLGIADRAPVSALGALKLIELPHRLIIIRMIRSVCASGQRFQHEYPVCHLPTKTPAWLQISGQLQTNERNQPFKFSGTLTDITEQKQKELLKDDLLAILSHELKSPLSTVKLCVQRAIKIKQNDHLATDLLKRADGQVDEMTSIIDNILDMSLIASGKKNLQLHCFDINTLIQEVTSSFFYHVKTHYINACNDGVQLIYADRSKIKQVLHNLLSNAIKYAPEQSAITISSTLSSGQIHVSVQDKGPGISEEYQQKLFNRFYRAESDEVKSKKGHGIGLYIVKEIVQQHRGRVWVESIAGSGTIFHFSLPSK